MAAATPTGMTTPHVLLAHLWQQASLPLAYLDAVQVHLPGPSSGGPSVPSTFKVGLLAQATIAAVACAQVLLEELQQRGGGEKIADLRQRLRKRRVKVDQRETVLEFASERYTRIVPDDNDVTAQPITTDLLSRSHHITSPEASELLGLPLEDGLSCEWDPLAGVYPCLDGYVRLHTNFPHHKAGLLRILDLLPMTLRGTVPQQQQQVKPADVTPAVVAEMEGVTRQQVGYALRRWGKLDFEKEVREQGMCATACRTEEEWDATEQARLTREVPVLLVDEVKVGMDGYATAQRARPPSNLSDAAAVRGPPPLRIIDMSRVIAAPVAGRALAVHGHAVMLLSSPHLPNLPVLEADTMRGKETRWLDLDDASHDGKATFRSSIKQSDVLLQSYRPGGLASRGLGVEAVLRLRPGLIYASLSAYGGEDQAAPWCDVRGFDSLVQNATGINHAEGMAFQEYSKGSSYEQGASIVEPKALPVQALDHAAGYLLALGVLAARCRQLLSPHDGGKDGLDQAHSYTVRVSLASVAQLLRSLGRYTPEEAFGGVSSAQHLPSHTSDEIKQHLVATPIRSAAAAGSDSQQGRRLWFLGVRHAAEIDGKRRHWSAVPAKLGVDGWLDERGVGVGESGGEEGAAPS